MKVPTAPSPTVPADLEDSRVIARARGVRGALTYTSSRIRSGEIGNLPIIIGIVIIWVLFEIANPVFLTSTNMNDLLVQSSSTGIIALGIVLVLLVGEIDLSVGAMSGVGSSILGWAFVVHGWPLGVAIAVALAAGIAVGIVYWLLFTHFQVASFVITMAGLLALSGLQLVLGGQEGSINIPFT